MDLNPSMVATLFGLTASSFVATNLDNLLLLVVLQGANPGARAAVLLGYLGAAIALLCVAALGLALGTVVEPDLLGYLGLIPLLFGLRMLYMAWLRERHPEIGIDTLAGRSRWSICSGTLMLMAGNSGDSLAVLLPLLAETGAGGQWFIASSYLMLAVVWIALAGILINYRALAECIERRGEKIVPWIMIGVGLYILLDTPTDSLG
ncbi:hypothetical protein F0M18_00575 [Pseudohalioglobus sediminis]|uniref:Cadmium transporter n=1 Tax=Pseudohalioglobus sediminis TaxID=2606449 RepID=A0A5B0X5L8_9GAMM|nr:cadmium resistance transporter [Pseudohalioglobus sediminis]KAA1193975.1 hypothetical protein F0M18_00575 [Pseudohalioglobus sediminis]